MNNPLSAHQTSRKLPAQKLAPSSSRGSSQVDYVKLYKASESESARSEAPLPGSKRKSILETLEDCNDSELAQDEFQVNFSDLLRNIMATKMGKPKAQGPLKFLFLISKV